MVLEMRGVVSAHNPWSVMVDLFFYRWGVATNITRVSQFGGNRIKLDCGWVIEEWDACTYIQEGLGSWLTCDKVLEVLRSYRLSQQDHVHPTHSPLAVLAD